MCNTSQQFSNTSLLNESKDWFCLCEGYFGPTITFLASILCFVVGTPVHCWSLWVFMHGNIKPNVAFPLIMTILELCFCTLCIIDISIIKYPSIQGDLIANFLLGVCWTFRPLIQICMCVEQYLAVIHPVTFLRYKDNKYRIVLVAVALLVSLSNSVRFIFIEVNYFRDHVFFVFFCIAVAISSFCCASVLHALKRPGPGDRNNVEMTEKDRHNKTDRCRAVENQQKRKAFKIIAHILVSILVCYIPLVVIYFMNNAKISRYVYLCEAVPFALSFTVTAILFSPLFRMYNEGYVKQIMCFSKLGTQIKEK